MNIPVSFYNRHGAKLRQADYINPQCAMTEIVKHMQRHEHNIVKVGDILCFTITQADKRTREFTQ